ncbi:MAG: glycosyltransferase [Fimbriiglobus sp.]
MTAVPEFSVVICTHNPRPHYLVRVLDALRAQTFPADRWELLLVDNASREPLNSQYDLMWHPSGGHVREDQLGLTPARLRAIVESKSELILFVDDDNVLSPDYLEQAAKIAQTKPFLGMWGGQVVPEFEVEPDPRLKPFLSYLSLRTTDRDCWSNSWQWDDSHPFGGGMCVRRPIAETYARQVRSDPIRNALDRRGTSLVSAGDFDLSRVACKMGYGYGVFRSLHLTHLIPAGRVQEEYLLRLLYGLAYSNTMLDLIYGHTPPDPNGTWGRAMKGWILRTFLTKSRVGARFRRVDHRGVSDAIRDWKLLRTGEKSDHVELLKT